MIVAPWQSDDVAVVDAPHEAALLPLPIDNFAFAVLTCIKENAHWHNQRERSHNHEDLPVFDAEHWDVINQSGQVRSHSIPPLLAAPHGRQATKGPGFRNVKLTGVKNDRCLRSADSERSTNGRFVPVLGQAA